MENLQVASAWLEKRETELAKPGAVERQNTPDPELAAVIDRYIEESVKEIGRTKAQVLATIKNYEITDLKCSEVTSEKLVAFAKELPVQPRTVPEDTRSIGGRATAIMSAFSGTLRISSETIGSASRKHCCLSTRDRRGCAC